MKIVFTRADGGVSIVNAVPKNIIERALGNLTDEEYKKHIWDKSVPKDAINPVEIDDDYVFPDREFRDAWVQKDKEITHDLKRVTAIQLERLRATRDALLVKYDGLQSRAVDLNDPIALADVKARKNALRGATNGLKALHAETIEEIKSSTPDLSGY